MSGTVVKSLGLSLFLLAGCGSPVETTLVTRTSSGDSTRDAIIFTKEVGATADTAYHVAVVDRGGGIPTDDDRTALIADHIDDNWSITVKWVGDSLEIYTPKTARVFRSLSKVRVGGRDAPVRIVAR